MTEWQALALGAVQGLTEFLPVSSTAHLRVVPAAFGWPDAGAAFTAVTQLGTLAAVLWYFRRDVARLARGFLLGLRRRQLFDGADSRTAWMIIVGTVPVVAAGLLLKDKIEGPFRSLYVIAGALIGLALVLWLAEWLARGRAGRPLERLTWADAVWIGIAQAFALVPGASRSGVTLTGGLLCGLDRAAAARYSFLLSLPSIFGAGVYELVSEWGQLAGVGIGNLVIATAAAGVVGYAAVAFLISYLKTHTTAVFIVYRIMLGVVIFVWLLS